MQKCKLVLSSIWPHVQYIIGAIIQYMRMREAKTFASAHHYMESALSRRSRIKGAHWGNERTAGVRDNRPVKSDESHAQAMIVSKEVVDNPACWPDPTYPVEHTKSSEEIARHEVPQKTAEKREEEEAFP